VCPPGKVCDPTTSPPSCSCGGAYTEVEGECEWKGDELELPSSLAECGRRAFCKESGFSGASIAVDDPGSLVLRVDGNCQTVSVETAVNLPAADALPVRP
jgi:hypothetical protein